jgi:proline dehydrogenase
MKTMSKQLRELAQSAPSHVKDVLVQAADLLEEQRLWKTAWVNVLIEIEQLTAQKNLLQSAARRKEKDR